jgi:hypothetical protein
MLGSSIVRVLTSTRRPSEWKGQRSWSRPWLKLRYVCTKHQQPFVAIHGPVKRSMGWIGVVLFVVLNERRAVTLAVVVLEP